jgi:hypothetical protein
VIVQIAFKQNQKDQDGSTEAMESDKEVTSHQPCSVPWEMKQTKEPEERTNSRHENDDLCRYCADLGERHKGN